MLLVNCSAIPNRRLLSRKTEFEFVRPFDLIPKYRAFCEARPAPASPCGINSGGASEQPIASEFEKSLTWSQLLNEARTFFERFSLEKGSSFVQQLRVSPTCVLNRTPSLTLMQTRIHGVAQKDKVHMEY